MGQQLNFCAIVWFFIACNNSTSIEEKNGDAITTTKNDTAKIIDTTTPASDLMALTAAEIKDDSVFADGSVSASWSNAGFSDSIAVKKFLKKVRYCVDNNQRDSVASIIEYPLKKPVIIKDVESFLKNYNTLITEKVKKSLLEQNLSQLFRNTQGVMIGSGELWINETPRGLKIIAINN